MITLTPSPDGAAYGHVTIKADEPVTVTIGSIDPGGFGHIVYVYRGVLAENDQDAEPVAVYDGSMGHDANVTVEVLAEDGACERCDGRWGEDATCARCTNEDGTPRPISDPGPLGPGSEGNPAYPQRVGLRVRLVEAAAGLLDVDEVHDNPEYLRGMVELIMRTTMAEQDAEDIARKDIEDDIEAEVRDQNAGLLSERAARAARGDAHYQG